MIRHDAAPIRVGLVGAGAMGKGLLFQSLITPAVRCVAICDRVIDRCVAALTEFDVAFEIVESRASFDAAVRRGSVAVSGSSESMVESDQIDAILEASNGVAAAATHSLLAMDRGKHVILMNSEIDLTFGPLLQDRARRRRVVCTSCDGDQYGALKHLIDDIQAWGLTLVMAGNIKGYLDRYANPTTIVEEADKRALDHRMCTSYTDGTKLNIEMAILANACGLDVISTGMSGPRLASVRDVLTHFDWPSLRRQDRPVVDYILGAEPGGGVFVVAHCDHPYQRRMLAYYKMGTGPFYLFYRPYHLCHIEAMQTVVRAVRERECFLAPWTGLQTNVMSYAKRDLVAGTLLDGIGGYDAYGLIESLDRDSGSGLPITLSEGRVLTRAIARDQPIRHSDVVDDDQRPDVELYAQSLALSRALSSTPR